MKVFNFKIGNDNGNSEHDLIIEGVQICQPNVYAKARQLPLLDEINPVAVIDNIHDRLLVTISSPSVKPGIYYVGKYALGSNLTIKNIEVGINNTKVDSDLICINTLAHIAGYAVKKAYDEDPASLTSMDIKVRVDQATALPINQYTVAKAKEFGQKFESTKEVVIDGKKTIVEGTHIVTVHLGPIEAKVEITFDFTRVIPEGVTGVWALQNAPDKLFKEHNEKNKDNKDKQITKEYFKDKRILHIAIGEGTTEFPITHDINFDPNFIKGENLGVGIAIDNSLDEFKKEFNLLVFKRQNYSRVLRDPSHKYYDTAKDIILDHLEEQAEAIFHYATSEIQKANNEVDCVVIYGGGSILMREYLESRIAQYCQKAKIDYFYVSEEFAVILESMGLYSFVTSDIFKKMKEVNLKKEANPKDSNKK